MSRKIWLTITLTVLTILAAAIPAVAQDKTLVWQRYDVNIFVEKNSDIRVEEVQNIEFTSGTFRFGFAAIPLDRVEQITDVTVSEIIDGAERAYTPNSSNAYGFTTYNTGTDLEITWYFPPTANTQHTYVLRYRVIGGLRIYDGGDQLWWKAIAPDHNFPIRTSRVTVTPPQVFTQNQLVVEAYGAPATATFTSGGQVVFEAQSIPADEMLEVRVQFPHGIVAGTAPGWQAADDLRSQWGPVLGVVSGALALLFLLGGPVGIYLLWYARGRDLPTGVVPEYITEPPSDLPAALVGTLVDEKADLKDVIAGILDLAQRGALRMEEETKGTSSGFGKSKEFVFHLQDADKAIYAHEKRLIERVFQGSTTRKLSDLHQKFYTAIPKLKTDLYNESVQQKLFPDNPDKVRGRWLGLAVAGFLLAIVFACLPLFALGDFSPLVACPGITLIASAISLMIVSRHMPRKTAQGAEEAAKWLAFKKYLETIEQHNDLESVKDKFETFLPYAMAFGLERRLIKKFTAVNTPAPTWWGPMYGPRPYYGYPHHHGHGQPGGGGSAGPTGGPPGSLAGEGGGVPSLSDMSDSMGTSLSSMSDSLGSMLSSASRTLTSQPPPPPSSSRSSGGWGGGGFSGGGFSGGGGGGGGSRGFG